MIVLPGAAEPPTSQHRPNPAHQSKTLARSAEFASVRECEAQPASQAPRGQNEPTAILATWTALEALSPQTYRRPEDLIGGDRRCVVSLSNGRLPWEIGERSRPNYQLYYQVPLGSVSMEAATQELIKAFGEDEERSRGIRERRQWARCS